MSTNTLTRYENGAELRARTLRAIQDALEAEGATFLEDDGSGAGPGVRLRPKVAAATVLMQAGD